MEIQTYTKFMAMIAKVEQKREQYDYFDAQLHDLNDKCLTKPYEWSLAYEAERKAAKDVRKVYKDYRKMVNGNDEIYFAKSYYYQHMTDLDFYLSTRWKLIEEARHIQFNVEHKFFV